MFKFFIIRELKMQITRYYAIIFRMLKLKTRKSNSSNCCENMEINKNLFIAIRKGGLTAILKTVWQFFTI